jgi:hypothetical protein
VRDKPRALGRAPKKGKEKIMKKAILIICVLSVLALLAVPVLAEVLSADSGLDLEMAPRPRPGTERRVEVESPVLIARGGCRAP